MIDIFLRHQSLENCLQHSPIKCNVYSTINNKWKPNKRSNMKKFLIPCLIALLTLSGCASNNVKETAIPQDKIYNVIFEGDPEITDKRVLSAGVQIGDVLVETPSSSDLTVVKISIKEAYTPQIRSNTVFVVENGYLKTDKVGETAEPVSEGARLLGFTGKTKLLWFKTKAKISGISKAAKNKAAELYNKATTYNKPLK